MSATTNVAGKLYDVVQNEQQRRKCYNEIKTIYDKIRSIDSSITLPEILPENDLIVPSNKQNGCYIATAIYGSYDCPEVWTLRRYRDYCLAKSWYGRIFIQLYYTVSPFYVRYFGHSVWFTKMWKNRLDRMVKTLGEKGFEDTPYDDCNW